MRGDAYPNLFAPSTLPPFPLRQLGKGMPISLELLDLAFVFANTCEGVGGVGLGGKNLAFLGSGG